MKKTAILYFFLFLLNIYIFLSASNMHAQEIVPQKTLLAIYNTWARDYKKLIELTEYKVFAWIQTKAYFLPLDKQHVLDLGCADGSVGEYIHTFRPDYIFTGVDYAENMVQHCRQKPCYTSVLQADLSAGLPKSIGTQLYDIVIATGCLEFIQNHAFLFKQISQSLRDKGLFLFTLSTKNNHQSIALDTPLIQYTCHTAQEIIERSFNILSLETYECAYKNSITQEPAEYYMIVSQKK